jgi:ABC-type Fe3+/spermidine/putrescine transport system ATPase subunit
MKSDDVIVSFRGVRKTYDGETLVVKSLDLDIHRGEFLTLLGPSGSGKTTCLMMLAGFEFPTGGEIWLDGELLNTVPPHKRNIGMVFQNYALFPHLTVEQNVAYPLTVRKLSAAERAERVAHALKMVQMERFAKRYPAQLSGGQQQRIALARALVFEPKLVLMDEPLGALDKQLREHMQYELKALHEKLGVTFVYVTHDQGEALTMSDRVAVFDKGIVQQLDTVDCLYESPCNEFVANFIGDSNRLRGPHHRARRRRVLRIPARRRHAARRAPDRRCGRRRAGRRLHPPRTHEPCRQRAREWRRQPRDRRGAQSHLFRRSRAHALRAAGPGGMLREGAARHGCAPRVRARRTGRARLRARAPARVRVTPGFTVFP